MRTYEDIWGHMRTYEVASEKFPEFLRFHNWVRHAKCTWSSCPCSCFPMILLTHFFMSSSMSNVTDTILKAASAFLYFLPPYCRKTPWLTLPSAFPPTSSKTSFNTNRKQVLSVQLLILLSFNTFPFKWNIGQLIV